MVSFLASEDASDRGAVIPVDGAGRHRGIFKHDEELRTDMGPLQGKTIFLGHRDHHRRVDRVSHRAGGSGAGGLRRADRRLRLIQRIADRLPEKAPLIQLDAEDREVPGHPGRAGSRRDRRGQQARRRGAFDRDSCRRPGWASTRSSTILRRCLQGHPHLRLLVCLACQGAAADHEFRRFDCGHGFRPQPGDAGLQLDDGRRDALELVNRFVARGRPANTVSVRISLPQDRSGRWR